MDAQQSRAVEERVADEIQRWSTRHPAFVGRSLGDNSAHVARDIGVGFSMGHIDAVAFGLSGPPDHDGSAPLLAVVRLRVAEPPLGEVQPAGDVGAPLPPEAQFGIWLRPTERARGADLPFFLSQLRLTWVQQTRLVRVRTIQPMRTLGYLAVEPGLTLLREGYGDVAS